MLRPCRLNILRRAHSIVPGLCTLLAEEARGSPVSIVAAIGQNDRGQKQDEVAVAVAVAVEVASPGHIAVTVAAAIVGLAGRPPNPSSSSLLFSARRRRLFPVSSVTRSEFHFPSIINQDLKYQILRQSTSSAPLTENRAPWLISTCLPDTPHHETDPGRYLALRWVHGAETRDGTVSTSKTTCPSAAEHLGCPQHTAQTVIVVTASLASLTLVRYS